MVRPLRTCAALLSMSLAVLSIGTARADSAIVLPHAGDSRLMAARETAQKAVLEALDEQGFSVRVQTSKAPRSSSEIRNQCAQVACASALLAAEGIELAVAVAVWESDDGPQANVTLVDALGRRYPGYAAIKKDDAKAAARAALLEARGLQLLGPGPWIDVRGMPVGATVLLDDKQVGALPYRATIESGDHVIEIRADNYETDRRRFTIPLDPTSLARIDVSLPAAKKTAPPPKEPEPEGPPAVASSDMDLPEEPPLEEGSPWNFILGGVLIAGGVALATIEPLQAAAKDGDCVDDRCERQYKFGTRSALQIAGGVALAGAGVALMIWQPIRVEVSSEHALIAARWRM